MKKSRQEILVLLFIGSLILLLYGIFQIPLTEGFNPSDDGVILAQSFRLLNGQIPHLDFISIRPVGSAYLHSLALLLPGSMEVIARWICLIEYLLLSFIWSYLAYVSWFKNRPDGRWWLLVFAVLSSVLSISHYNLFPWTTIDALLLFSISIFIFWQARRKGIIGATRIIYVAAIVFFASLAVLCRQSFALPALILGLWLLPWKRDFNQWRRVVVGTMIGLLPLWFYFGQLVMHAALPLFFDQMSGRTELLETGVYKFIEELWKPASLSIAFVLLFSLVLQKLVEDNLRFRLTILANTWLKFLLLGVTLVLTILVFWLPQQLFSISFVFFWLLVFLPVARPLLSNTWNKDGFLIFWSLLLAWTSAISLGDNAPVFALGIMAVVIVAYLGSLSKPSVNTSPVFRGLAIGLTALLLFSSIYAQRKNNYRDLEAKQLHFSLRSIFPELGGIQTNPRTYQYLSELKAIYTELGEPHGRFVVMPNSALIYPLLGSDNPFPLDWMQQPEFVGQEEDLQLRLDTLSRGDGIYLLFDKYDSKRFAEGLIEMNYSEKMYPYYSYLINNSQAIEQSSDWFVVRVLQ